MTITLPGAEKAYAVQQPDVGWVVGAIAKDRFVQVHVGGIAGHRRWGGATDATPDDDLR